MFGYQLISECLGQRAKLGLAAGVGADIPADCKVRLGWSTLSRAVTHLRPTAHSPADQPVS
jgi:hypothetical protein